MIRVKILTPEYGDKTMTMTVSQFQDLMEKNQRKGWAIFANDTTVPIEEQATHIGSLKIQDIKDGQSIVVVPQLAGG